MKNNLSSLFKIVLLMIFTSGSLYAQITQELRIGSSVSGNLGAFQEIWYSVRTTQAGFLTVGTRGNVDTYLVAYDAQRSIIIENDDGEDLNARVEFVAQANTTYLFKLSGYSDSSGAFQISASHRPMPAITDLRSGSFKGNLARGQEYWFSVPVTQTGVLNIHTTGDMDTLLEAYNRNFVFLHGDDDSGEGYNAAIKMDVRAGETYYFKMRAFSDNYGPYNILANVTPHPTPIHMNPGTFHNGYIESETEQWFSARAPRNGYFTIETMGSTDTIIAGFTDSYEYIYEHDDQWYLDTVIDRNAKLFMYVEFGRVYIFRLRSFGSGPYRLIVDFVEGDPPQG